MFHGCRNVFGAVALLFSLFLSVTAAHASPCTNNGWQPTFVHDLEIADGPFYVMPGGNFVLLRYTPPQEFVPHACQLIQQNGVRNTAGFTTCQAYTRIQCGCSRSISLGNATCAAFLRWRPIYNITPGVYRVTGAGPGQVLPIRFSAVPEGLLVGTAPPGAAVNVLGMCTGNYCKITFGSFTGWVDKRALSPGGMSGVHQPQPQPQTGMANCQRVGQWQRMGNRNAPVSMRNGAVVLTGGNWQNGRLRNGIMDGNGVQSASTYNFSQGGVAMMRFSVNGGGKYMSIVPRILTGVGGQRLSTHNSWANSIVVPDGAWLFGKVTVSPGGSYTLTVSRNGYDGAPILRSGGRLGSPVTSLAIEFVDNYAGSGASVTIAEALACPGAGGSGGGSGVIPDNTGLFANPQGTQPQPGGGGGRPCSTDADCGGSVCLLGVCAGAVRRYH